MLGMPKWKDVMVFGFAGYTYLLQGKKFKNGKTVFRVAHMKNFGGCIEPKNCTEEHLKSANLWETDDHDH